MIKYTNWLTLDQDRFDILAPGTVLSALDFGMGVVIDTHPLLRIPAHILTHPRFKVRHRNLEDYDTTNYTLPRFLELPALLKEHGKVLLTDFDTVLLRRPVEENRLVFWLGGNFDGRYKVGSWDEEGQRIMATHVAMVGDTGLAFAEAVAEEIRDMGRKARDTWFSDQVALWRAWSNRGPWPDIRHQPHFYHGLQYKDRSGAPCVHAGNWDEKAQPWVEYTREYQDRWHR